MSNIFRKLITVCGYYELCLLKVKRCTLRQTQGDKKNSHKFNNLWELSACCPINSAERGGFEPITLTAYISATLLSKFQIGNETVTIFNR